MEAQSQNQYSNNPDDATETAGVNPGVQVEDDKQHNGKRSVFKKVKDKAKKLKETITKHGHSEQVDDEDEDEVDDEMEEDPAVHASSVDAPGAHQGLDLEKHPAIGEDPYSFQKNEPAPGSRYDPEERNQPPLSAIPERRALDPSGVYKENEEIQQQGVKFGELEDPQDPRGSSNHQTKSIDHTGKGSQEADVASLIQSFDKTGGVHGDYGSIQQDSANVDAASEAELAQSFGKMGVHDEPKTANPTDSIPKSADSITPEHLHHDTTGPKPSEQGSYLGNLASYVPSVITDNAISAKNIVASKLGYGGTKDVETEQIDEAIKPPLAPETGEVTKPASSAANVVASKRGYGSTKDTEEPPRTEQIAGATKPASAPETGEVAGSPKPASQGMAAKVTETLAPVYAKVADTGSSVISRITGSRAGGKEEAPVSGDDNNGTSMKEKLYEKFKPGEDEKSLSGKISDALNIRKLNPTKAKEEPKTVGTVVDATEEEPTVLAEAKMDGDKVKAAGPKDVDKGAVDYVKDTVGSWFGKGGQQQQHTQESSDSQSRGEGPTIDKTGHVQGTSDDKKME